jgi:hypothetical protein
MPEGLLQVMALAACFAGIGWLALAMDVHWEQVRGRPGAPGRVESVGLRVLGVATLLASLGLELRADNASIAVLVWVMSLAVASFAVAQALAWRPAWLRWLLPFGG